MRKVSGLVLWVQVCVWICALGSCKNEAGNTTNNNNSNGQALQYTLKEIKKKGCVSEGRCALFSISYPVLASNTNAEAAELITDSISTFLFNITSSDTDLPLDKALNASADAMIDDYKEFVSESEEGGGDQSRTIEATSDILLNNPKIISVYIESYEYLGGAHPNTSVFLQSFSVHTGEAITIDQLVNDTNRLQTILEPKYKESKGMKANGDIKELLFEEFAQLPLSANFAVVSKGIRFYYNDYEVASHAVGPSDILVTWEELGALSDKNKWF